MGRWLGLSCIAGLLVAGPCLAGNNGICRDMAASIKVGARFDLRPEFIHQARSQSVEFWRTHAVTGDLPVKPSLMPSRDRLLAEAKPLGQTTFTVMSWVLAKTDKDPIFTADDSAADYTQIPVGNLLGLMADVPGGGDGASRWAFVYWDAAKKPHVAAPPAYIGDRDIEENSEDQAVLADWQGAPVFVETHLVFFGKGADEEADLNVTPWAGDHFGETCHIAITAGTRVQPEPSLVKDTSPFAQWVRSNYRRWRADDIAFNALPPAKRLAYQSAILGRFGASQAFDAMLKGLNADPHTRLRPDQLAVPLQSGKSTYLVAVNYEFDNDNSLLWTFKFYSPSPTGSGVGKADEEYDVVRERPVSISGVVSGVGAFKMP